MGLQDELRAEKKSQGVGKTGAIQKYLDTLTAKERAEWLEILKGYDHSNRAIRLVLKKRDVTTSMSAVQSMRARLRDSARDDA